MSNNAQHLLRCTQELKDKLKELADQENRSLNNFIVTLLEDYVNQAKNK